MDGKALKHTDALLGLLNGCQEPGKLNAPGALEPSEPNGLKIRPRIGKVFVCGTASDFKNDQSKLLWEKQ